MSICPKVTEQDLFKFRKLAEQQKNQCAIKTKNRILKQIGVEKIAENLPPKTKKLEEVKKSTQILGEVIKESNSEKKFQEIFPNDIESEDENIQTSIRAFPNIKQFSTAMTEILGALMSSKKSLKLKKDDSIRGSILGTTIFTFAGGRKRIKDNIHDLTPETNKALSSTSYTGKILKNENHVFNDE